MPDRIIDANILMNYPKISFSANNIIRGVEFEEGTVKIENRVIGASADITPYSQGSNRDNYIYRLNDDNFNPINYKLSYYQEQTSSTQIQKLLKADINIPIKEYVAVKNIEVLFESTTDSWFASNEYFNTVNKWKNSTFIESVSYNNGIVNIKTRGPVIYVKDTNQTPTYYSYSKKIVLHVVADVIEQERTNKVVGTKPNIIINSNELMQVDTTVNGIPIGNYIANDIINEYKNGKTTVRCTVIIDGDTERFKINEIVKVYDFNGKSIARYRDGTDKRFKITDAELIWNGQVKQNLNMVEVIKNGI